MNNHGDRHLWMVPYGSAVYNKVNVWTQFMLSQSLTPQQLRQGQSLLVHTQGQTPHKWTLVFSVDQKGWGHTLTHLKKMGRHLKYSHLSLFVDSKKDLEQASSIFEEEILRKKISIFSEG